MTTTHEIPRVDRESRPFWDAAARGELALPYCPSCARWVWLPRSTCDGCHRPLDWRPASGFGVLTSFTIERRATVPRWRDRVPYVIGYVTLDEGVAMISNVVGADPDSLATGARVRVDFEPTDDPSLAVPVFALADGEANPGGADG